MAQGPHCGPCGVSSNPEPPKPGGFKQSRCAPPAPGGSRLCPPWAHWGRSLPGLPLASAVAHTPGMPPPLLLPSPLSLASLPRRPSPLDSGVPPTLSDLSCPCTPAPQMPIPPKAQDLRLGAWPLHHGRRPRHGAGQRLLPQCSENRVVPSRSRGGPSTGTPAGPGHGAGLRSKKAVGGQRVAAPRPPHID